MRGKQSDQSSACTLIELLVVIAITASSLQPWGAGANVDSCAMSVFLLERHGAGAPFLLPERTHSPVPTVTPPLNNLPNGINVAFVDGHVQFQRLGDLFNLDIWNSGWAPVGGQ